MQNYKHFFVIFNLPVTCIKPQKHAVCSCRSPLPVAIKEARSWIKRTFGSCRYAYNHYLANRQEVYNAGYIRFSVVCSANMTHLKKKADTAWLQKTGSIALQSALRDSSLVGIRWLKEKPTSKRASFLAFESAPLLYLFRCALTQQPKFSPR